MVTSSLSLIHTPPGTLEQLVLLKVIISVCVNEVCINFVNKILGVVMIRGPQRKGRMK